MYTNQKQNKTAYFEVWSEEQLLMLHHASLDILERTGVQIHDEGALKVLKDNGAWVEGNVAKIPAAMVEAAIASAPSKAYIMSTDGKTRMNLCRNNINFGLGTDLPAFMDPYTGELRDTVLNDVYNVAKVTQTCDNIDFIASLGLASDVDQHLVDLYHYKAMRTYCSKPIWMTAVDAKCLQGLIDMAAVQAGGYDALRQNPTIGLYNEPISPLVYSQEAIQKLMLCAQYGIPTTWASGIIMGGTGPSTLAGAMALGNAEGLGGLVIHQLVAKGAPFIFGIIFSAMDMRTTISSYASPEFALGHIISAQLGRMYNLPTYGTGGTTDSNALDVQAGMEAMFTNMAMAMGGASLIHDNGYMGAGLIGSLEMILLDDEIARFVKNFLGSAEINEETLALDVIHEVGHGGNFIDHEHTFENFRNHIYSPRYSYKKDYHAWMNEGSPTMKDAMHARALEIIEKDAACLLSKAEMEAFDKIIADVRAKF